jgi:Tol biopolymer transport system component
MKRIDAKWLVRVLVLAVNLVAVAAILIGSARLADVVAGLIIVGVTASWVVAWRSRKETLRFFPAIIALALFWSAGLLALFAWLDTPPSIPAAEPAGFVPNGTGRIAFTEQWEIYVMNADGTGKTRLTVDEYGGSCPAWSPAGEQLAFERQDEIYVMNADGTNPTRLTNSLAATNSCPLWSPDGQRIAFLSNRSGTWEAYVMKADGTHQTRLTHNYQNRQCTPAWSPDGQHLAFVSRHSDGSPEIYVLAADGTDPIYLTRDAWYPLKNTWRAAWSPDGEQLAFLGQDGIYVMSADGADRTRLTDLGSASYACNNPVWSPDGQRIAFVSGGNGDNIYVMDVDGTNPTRITAYEAYPSPNHAAIQEIIWSPDSKHIAYDAGVPVGLNMLDLDGTNLVHLGSGDSPTWAP